MRRNPVAFTVRNWAALTEASLPPVLADVEALNEPILSHVSLEGTEGSLPAALANDLPSEVTAFFLELTDEDKAVLKDLASRIQQFSDEEELLAALKEKSPKLYEKAAELRTLIRNKIDYLNPEAKSNLAQTFPKLASLILLQPLQGS